MKLSRPIAVIDLETTGTDIETARIVSIGIVFIGEDGKVGRAEELLVNPGIPIPSEASAVHGITDEMVSGCPIFREQSESILAKLRGCDLAGFNIEKYDLPILRKEFARAGVVGAFVDAKVIDTMVIYHKNVRRDLSAAVQYYLNRSHEGAHSAIDDAKATAEILLAQVQLYNLPTNTVEIDAYCHEKPRGFIDQEGQFIWKDNIAVLNFGKMKGVSLKDLADQNQAYLRWMLEQTFTDEVKIIVQNALEGRCPDVDGR